MFYRCVLPSKQKSSHKSLAQRSPSKLDEIYELLRILKNCEEVPKFLQNENPVKASLDMVRAAFDTLIADYPVMKSV